MKKWWMSIGTGILVIAGALFWWSQATTHTAQGKKEEKPAEEHAPTIVKLSSEQVKKMGIILQSVEPAQLEMTLSARGKIILHPDRLAHIYSKVPGVARDAFKNMGDEVRQGEQLAIFESREMADVKANYLAAVEKEKFTQVLLNRERRLHQKQISAEQDYLNALSAYEEARIHMQKAKQQLHAFGLTDQDIADFSVNSDPDLRSYAIRAPIDGTIISRHITKGEFIDNTAMIYEIADLSHVWIEIGIYPNDLPKVKIGQMVQVTLPVEDTTIKAQIIYVSPIVQEETITSKAIAMLCNTDRNWRPGTYVTVNIDTDKVSVPLAIPREAVQDIDGDSFVFVEVPEGFEKRNVKTGKSDVAYVEVLTGLQSGEKLAASKTFLLKAELGKDDVEDDD